MGGCCDWCCASPDAREGMLQVQRPVASPDFTAEHERRLARLEPFLTHALATHPGAHAPTLVDSGESGMIIANRDGQVLEYSV